MNKILKPAAFAAVAFCILVLTQTLSNLSANYALMRMPEQYAVYGLIRAVVYLLLAGICLVLVLKLFHLTAEECWIKPVRVSRIWVISSLLVCMTLVVVYFLAAGIVMMNKTVPDLTGYLWIHGIAYFVICSTIVEGVVLAIALKIGEQAFGQIGAIIYSTAFLFLIYFSSVHLKGIELFLYIIGIALNVVVQVLIIVESKAVWNSIMFHGIWNFFLASGIVFIGEWHGEQAVFTIPFENTSILLTGGAAGCEASLPAMGALGVMLFIVIGKMREKSKVVLQTEGKLEQKDALTDDTEMDAVHKLDTKEEI